MCNLNYRAMLLILCLSFCAENLCAQTNAEVNAGVQFNFSTPGARSLAMGGAFLGLADDATAAYANPAGLTTLSRPEISFEARHWHFLNTFTDRGRLKDAPTGRGVDTIAGLRDGQSGSNIDGLSFFSYVYPKTLWTVAVYRHELVNFAANYRTQGAFIQGNQAAGLSFQRLKPTRDALSLKVVNLGIASAFHLDEKISIGLGLSAYDFNITSTTDRLVLIGDDSRQFDPPNFESDPSFDSQTQNGSGRKIALNAGFTWAPSAAWKVGGVFRQGPKFNFDARYRRIQAGSAESQDFSRQAVFNIPDILGLGVSYQSTELRTILLDIVHVEYSDLTQNFTNIFPSEPACLSGHCQFSISDATEVHLGFEQNIPLPNALLAARIGTWFDPDHRIRFTGETLANRAIFKPGKDQIHYSAGIGYISSRYPLQLDAAIDLARKSRTLSFSTVFRF